jgi:acyl-CoA hydrolase
MNDDLKRLYPEKLVSEAEIFSHIHRGDRIFISTGCAEPQYLVRALINYVQSHPKALFDTEVLHVWTLGVAPYAEAKWVRHFRHNSFFIGEPTREAVNQGLADYTPIFLSKVPDLLRQGLVTIDVALIQTSPPDSHGYLSLGISVDIVKAAVQKASLVIAQINANMPRIHGDGFIHISDVDFMALHN